MQKDELPPEAVEVLKWLSGRPEDDPSFLERTFLCTQYLPAGHAALIDLPRLAVTEAELVLRVLDDGGHVQVQVFDDDRAPVWYSPNRFFDEMDGRGYGEPERYYRDWPELIRRCRWLLKKYENDSVEAPKPVPGRQTSTIQLQTPLASDLGFSGRPGPSIEVPNTPRLRFDLGTLRALHEVFGARGFARFFSPRIAITAGGRAYLACNELWAVSGQVHVREQPANDDEQVFRRNGDTWVVTFDGVTTHIKGVKGLNYLAFLLRCPGKDVFVQDLVNTLGQSDSRKSVRRARGELTQDGLSLATTSSDDDVLDSEAMRAYNNRLKGIRGELDEAKKNGDLSWQSRLEKEKDQIVEQLQAALGLGGRHRHFPSQGEKTRKAVSITIKRAIARVVKHHKSLGRHLTNSIRTGICCSYHPEQPIKWNL